MNQVDPQHRSGDAVDHRTEEVRPRQEVKKQRNRQRDSQDHGKVSGSLQENIIYAVNRQGKRAAQPFGGQRLRAVTGILG